MKKGRDTVDPKYQNIANFAQQNIFRDIVQKLVEERDLSVLAREILLGANKLIPFTEGAIGLVDGEEIMFPYTIGEFADSVQSFKIPIGDGLVGWAVKNKNPVNVGDIHKDKRHYYQSKTTKSELDVPIIYQGKSIGVINIESSLENAFTENDKHLLITFAEYAAIAVNNAKLFNEMNALREIDQRLTSTLDSIVILELILKTVSDLIKCQEASVGIVDQETGNIHFTFAKGPFSAEVSEYIGNVGIGLSGWAVREKKSVRVGDVTKDPRYQPQLLYTRSEMDVPLLLGEEVIGVLNAESHNFNAFSEHDEYLLVSLASQAALAIRNAGLYEEVKEKLEAERELLTASETMAAIGDIGGSMVHRMNNDVGAIRVRAQQIIRIVTNNSKLDQAQTIMEVTEKAQIIDEVAGKILGDLRSFREQYKEVVPSWIDINQIVNAALKDVPIPSGIMVLNELGDDLEKFWGAEAHLKEVFRNLVANAVQAMPNGGKLKISSQQDGNKMTIRVKDAGVGISDENRKLIFQRGFSTKKEGQGFGYGLWWVKTYLNRNNAQIEIEETKLGVGTTFVITLLHIDPRIEKSKGMNNEIPT